MLTETAEKYGWSGEKTNGGHYKFRHPEIPDRVVITASTPGNPWRTLKNFRAELRRMMRERGIEFDD